MTIQNPIRVSDFAANAPEMIDRAVRAIGKSKDRRAVFEAIYFNKARKKSITEVSKMAKLKRKRVLEEGQKLYVKHVVDKDTKNGEIAYSKIDGFYGHKAEILSYLDNPKKFDKLATKRKIHVTVKQKPIVLPAAGSKAHAITIDEVDSFKRVRKVKKAGSLPATLSETAFKKGVQAIIGEKGKFKDWPGEQSDLFTTRLWVRGKRRAAAFAFKGPGLRQKLTPKLMGKHGNQALRLFREPAEVFFVQHWREIDADVLATMREFARARSQFHGPVWYGIIDGTDSERLRLAYPSEFKPKKRRK